MSNIQNFEKNGSFFPNEIVVKNYKLIDTSSKSRLAWCYGDLGILHSLLLVSSWINDDRCNKEIISLLTKTITRKKIAQTGVRDACFCHGFSGNAYLYLNLNHLIKNKIFLAPAEYWLKKTLSHGAKTKNNLGYLFFNGVTGWEKSGPDLIAGLGGITLAYLKYLHENLFDTCNEVFFLS